ncbi:MAG: hypothetical protein PF574_00530 [Candidatus Delongbacteria bacterium]|jgi:hypothetical protein|nr:hypothetical protein [Candidatus Delongbacteria bacterium]
MKKILKNILLISLIGLLVACSDFKKQKRIIKTIVNLEYSIPEQLDLEKIYSIDSTEVNLPLQSCLNSKDELYVLEYFSKKINVFDQKGKFLRKYDNICDSSNISSFSIFNDTLFVSCSEDKSYRTINEEGNVIRKIMLDNESAFDISFINEDNILGLFRTLIVKNKELYVNLDLKLVDKQFNTKKLISSFFNSVYQMSYDPEITMLPYAVNKVNDMIYLGITSPEKYSIYAYNNDLDLKFVVDNKADTIAVTKDEFKLKLKRAKKFKLPLSKSLDLKDNIENMFCDIEGNIWVRRGVDYSKYSYDTSILDVFKYNGKYIKSFFMRNTSRFGDIKIFEDKLVVVNPEISKIDVYKLNLPDILK